MAKELIKQLQDERNRNYYSGSQTLQQIRH